MARFEQLAFSTLAAPVPHRTSHGRHAELRDELAGSRALVAAVATGGLALIATVAMVTSSFAGEIVGILRDAGPQAPVPQSAPPFGGDADGRDDARIDLTGSSAQEVFRAGDFSLPLPDAGSTTRYTAFTEEYPDATEWLHAGADLPLDSLTVVFTDDPRYNCGIATDSITVESERGVAGCYDPSYYNTIFMWWGPAADEQLKAFILLHELSHFFQWWDYYDTVNAAFRSGLFDDEDVRREIMESDATCRVIEQWGVAAPQSAITVPCEVSDWHDTWITDQVRDRGTEIVAW